MMSLNLSSIFIYHVWISNESSGLINYRLYLSIIYIPQSLFKIRLLLVRLDPTVSINQTEPKTQTTSGSLLRTGFSFSSQRGRMAKQRHEASWAERRNLYGYILVIHGWCTINRNLWGVISNMEWFTESENLINLDNILKINEHMVLLERTLPFNPLVNHHAPY